jgi:hypothetical protein
VTAHVPDRRRPVVLETFDSRYSAEQGLARLQREVEPMSDEEFAIFVASRSLRILF